MTIDYLAWLDQLSTALRASQEATRDIETLRSDVITEAHRAGHSLQAIADASGVSKARVHQLARKGQ